MLPIKTAMIMLLTFLGGQVSSTVYAAEQAKQSGTDPTRPAVNLQQLQQVTTSVSVTETLVLQSIMKSNGRFFVVINDQMLGQGEAIDGVKIQTISSNQVILSDGRILRLFTAITNK